jgi:hypothetical protein
MSSSTTVASISPAVRIRYDRFGASCGFAFVAVFLVFFWLVADLLPPIAPDLDAGSLAQRYAEHRTRLRLGLALMIFFAPILCIPFAAATSRQVRRIEGGWGLLSLSQLMCGLLLPIVVMFPGVYFAAAVYREDRPAEVTQALSDVFWMSFVGIVGNFCLQGLILAAAAFSDRDGTVFPRWFGYVSLWYALLAFPGSTIFLFHHGLLAWNGLLAWWIPLIAFGIWTAATSAAVLYALNGEARSLTS